MSAAAGDAGAAGGGELAFLGGGGHARSVCEALPLSDVTRVIYYSDDPSATVRKLPKGSDDWMTLYPATEAAIIAVGDLALRRQWIDAFDVVPRAPGVPLRWLSVIHPTAVIARDAVIEPGNFIGAFAYVGPGCRIRPHCIINTRACIEYDSSVGPNTHVAPGATICSGVTVGGNVLVGVGSTVTPDVRIFDNVLVGAGATVITNIAEGDRVQGLAAKAITGGGGGAGKAGPAPRPTAMVAAASKPAAGAGAESTAAPASPSAAAAAQVETAMKPSYTVRWTEHNPLRGERALELLAKSAASGHLTNDGPAVLRLAKVVRALLEVKHDCVMTGNGTAAIHALAAAMNMRAERTLRWATQAFTFPSSNLGPLRDSLVLDDDEAAGGPSLEQLEAHKDEIDVVVVTNPFGLVTDVLRYRKWCKANDKLLVLDNAATPYTFVADEEGNQVNSCDLCDASIISFHETKMLGRGEGGCVLCPTDLAKIVIRACNFGFGFGAAARVHKSEASNWRMSDIAAAFLHANLEAWTATRIHRCSDLAKVAVRAVRESPHLDWLLPHQPPSGGRAILGCIPLRCAVPIDVAAFASATGIEAKQYYLPLRKDCPVAQDKFAHVLCLPLHSNMSKATVLDLVAAAEAHVAAAAV